MSEPTGQSLGNLDFEAYIQRLIDTAARQRLPELFAGEHPDALYHLPDRHGVRVLALRTTSLSADQILALLRYRLGQYLHPAVNTVNARMVYETRMEHAPLSHVGPGDVHFIAGSVETGEILCYAVLRTSGEAPPGTTLRTWERPLFPVEKVHGWGIYNRLRFLPDLPVAKVRELRHFIKNQRLYTFDELGARAPVEIALALFRTLAGSLRLEIDAVVGDLEESGARQTLEFFHVPILLIPGTVPYAPEDSYYFPRYHDHTVYPFGTLISDISAATLSRLDAIEQALVLPGKQGLLALFDLKRDLQTPPSSLEPPEGLAPLASAELRQQGVAMDDRRQMLNMAERLRMIDLFSGLTDAEARVLGTLMQEEVVDTGQVIVRQGEVGEDLYLIESGHAEVRLRSHTGHPLAVAILRPGDYFGEIAMVAGGRRVADVVAASPMLLLRLSKDAYFRYLAQLAEVEQQISRTAATRAVETLHMMARGGD